MKMQDLKEIARKNGVKAGKMRKTDLVLAIQKAEGNCEMFCNAVCQRVQSGKLPLA